MRIYTKIRIAIDTLGILEERYFEYEGPLTLCGMGADSDGAGGAEAGGERDGDTGGFVDLGGSVSENDSDESTNLSDLIGRLGENFDWSGFETGVWGSFKDPSASWGNFGGYGDAASIKTERGWGTEIMGRSFGLALSIASNFISPGLIDPFLGMDLGLRIFDAIEKYSTPYNIERIFSGDIEFNTSSLGGDSSNQQFTEAVNALLNNYARARTTQSDQYVTQQKTTQNQYVQATMPEYNKFVQTPEPIEDSTFAIIPMMQYSVCNFNPPVSGNMYSQPNTSIWYT